MAASLAAIARIWASMTLTLPEDQLRPHAAPSRRLRQSNDVGVETPIVERFDQAGVPAEKISMVTDTFHFVSPDKSPADVIDAFRRFYGPTMNAVDAAEKNRKVEERHRQLVELER